MKDGIDAALNWGNNKAYFFKGNQYIRWTIGRGEYGKNPGYPKSIAGNWDSFMNDRISAAVNWNLVIPHFRYDDDINDADKEKLIERHTFVLSKIYSCKSLSPEAKEKLIESYRSNIRNSRLYDPKINGGGSAAEKRIWINFDNLRNDDREFAQTIIHEMMHIAGYAHPKKEDSDQPGDDGQYYGSPPLQAELCIDGKQS